jgi:hypothetical protein
MSFTESPASDNLSLRLQVRRAIGNGITVLDAVFVTVSLGTGCHQRFDLRLRARVRTDDSYRFGTCITSQHLHGYAAPCDVQFDLPLVNPS